jgi:hypothetical protein
MTSEDDWTLPDDYWAEHHADGRVTLWRKDRSVCDFRRGHRKRRSRLGQKPMPKGAMPVWLRAAPSDATSSRPTSAP